MQKTVLLLFLFLTLPLYAQDEAAPAKATEATAEATDEAAAKATDEAAAKATDEATAEKIEATDAAKGLPSEVGEVIDAAKDLGSDEQKAPLFLLISALLAAVFKVLLSVSKVIAPFLKEKKGKLVLKIIAISLGAAAWLVSQFALGMPWHEALVVGLSGPLSIALHEITKIVPAFANKSEEKIDEKVDKPAKEA